MGWDRFSCCHIRNPALTDTQATSRLMVHEDERHRSHPQHYPEGSEHAPNLHPFQGGEGLRKENEGHNFTVQGLR